MPALLRGEQAKAAREALGALSRRLLALRPSPKDDASLGSGTAGLAIVHAVLGAAIPGAGHDRAADHALDCAIEAMATQTMGPSLYAGFVGIAWAAQRLRGDPHLQAQDDALVPIDEALGEYLDHTPWGEPYDLIGGLVGVGVYALERLPRRSGRRLVDLVVARLGETTARRAPGLAWRSRPEWLPPGVVQAPFPTWNLGLAHGVPGVIGVLGGVCGADVSKATARKARSLLEGASEWLLAQQIPDGDARFGWAIGSGIARTPARSAWCYGDPGVAGALLAGARAAKDRALERTAIAIALGAAARDPEKAGVIDGELCHGGAGLAHIFHRFYEATGDRRFAGAARAWFARTLAMRRSRGGFAGFRNYLSREDDPSVQAWQATPALLTGAGGIALALAAAVKGGEAWWDRALLLSLPP